MMHAELQEELVTYLGRAVPRKGFRAYIFASDGRKKIVESYEAFDLYVHSDEWFATPEEAQGHLEVPKKSVKKSTIKPKVVNGLIEEDFLPNETGE